jgi:hypothetical protein
VDRLNDRGQSSLPGAVCKDEQEVVRAISTRTPKPGAHARETDAGSLRIELFSDDLDALVDFYTPVLDFDIFREKRLDVPAYVAMRRGVSGWASRSEGTRRACALVDRPPASRSFSKRRTWLPNAITSPRGGHRTWALVARPWGLTDFSRDRPARHYLRLT